MLAGAWPMPPGEVLVIVPFTATQATKDFDASGRPGNRSPYSKREFAPYLEYGLDDDITLVSTFARTNEKTSWLGQPISQQSLSRIEAGLRFALGTWQETLFSIQPLVAWHGVTSANDPLASRRGDIDGEFDLAMGQNFTWFGMEGFTDNMVGLRLKPANRPNEVKVNLTIGLRPFERTLLLLKSESYSTISRGENAVLSTVQSSKLGLSLVREIDRTVSMELGAMTSISGRNVIQERSLILALWYHF